MHLRLLFVLALTCAVSVKAAEPEVLFDSTNLPLLIINTNGGVIANEPKITVDMKIIFNGFSSYNSPADPGNIYTGKAGIECHKNPMDLKPGMSKAIILMCSYLTCRQKMTGY
jgi:hypothetical protein